MKKIMLILIFFISVILTSGCSDKNNTPTITGQFIDSPVEGLNYFCSSDNNQSGVTNANGEYTCNVGDTVEFKIGSYSLGSTTAASVITPETLYPTNTEAKVNVLRLLQTLDKDNNASNGIALDSNLVELLNEEKDNIAVTSNEADFEGISAHLGGKALVSSGSALGHFEDNTNTLLGSAAPTHGAIKAVFSTKTAFAALRYDGSVVTWGKSYKGGDSSGDDLSNTKTIFSTSRAFAALKNDGRVVTWGDNDRGGKIGYALLFSKAKVITIFSNTYAFAALEADGSVTTWGDKKAGGDSIGSVSSNIKTIFSNDKAFAALKNDGYIDIWGKNYGDDYIDSADTKTIFSTNSAFAALKNDGRVVTWGLSDYGGDSSGVDFH